LSITPYPEPPVNVRAEMRDGRTIPLELAYIGKTSRGTHVWRSTWPLPGDPRSGDILNVRADQLPTNALLEILTANGMITRRT
jgi:hypothetical protein